MPLPKERPASLIRGCLTSLKNVFARGSGQQPRYRGLRGPVPAAVSTVAEKPHWGFRLDRPEDAVAWQHPWRIADLLRARRHALLRHRRLLHAHSEIGSVATDGG